MPRRKKKSSLARKPSLVFTESPVHVQNNVPSPVLCARHPPTAFSVPVDELDHLPWVSPQFSHVRHSGGHGKRKQTRQRRHSVAGHRNITSCNIDNKENMTNSERNRLRKFNSLKFLGDKTQIPSIIEDIEVSIDEETESDDNKNETGFNEIKEKGSPNDCSESRKSRTESGRYVLERTGNGAKLQTGTDDCFTVKSEKNDIELINDDAMSEIPESSCIEITDLNNTQRRHTVKEKPPIKRLFASQLLGKDHKENEKCSGLSVNNGKRKKAELNVSDSDTDSVSSPFIRRSERLQELRKMLLSSESPCSFRKLTCEKLVLAPNTPENEYGWSKRKRQLITYIKKKS